MQVTLYMSMISFILLNSGHPRFWLRAKGSATAAAEAHDPKARASGNTHPVPLEVIIQEQRFSQR